MSSDAQIDLNGFVSSKRASQVTGYTQDYIGQLARAAHIDARRIGGLWYISMDSLSAYKNKAEDFKPTPPMHDKTSSDTDALVTFDGKEYISANRASKVTGYNQDYIGQLARNGKIVSRQVGNRWYVEREGLLAHQEEKNALLAAVQAESVGMRAKTHEAFAAEDPNNNEPLLTYATYGGDLMPSIAEKESVIFKHVLPIRILERSDTDFHKAEFFATKSGEYTQNRAAPRSGKTMYKAALPAFALTVVVIVSLGLVSLKKDSLYTIASPSATTTIPVAVSFAGNGLVANASSAFDRVLTVLEHTLTSEMIYRRSE